MNESCCSAIYIFKTSKTSRAFIIAKIIFHHLFENHHSHKGFSLLCTNLTKVDRPLVWEWEGSWGMAETNNVDHGSVEISYLNKLLASTMKGKLCHESPSFPESCIFKVPRKLRRRNDHENVFDPNIVSIGPFHRGKDRLAPMEKIKWWYMHCLLDRLQLPLEETLEHYVESIRKLCKRGRECYAEPINLNDNKFIEMMVVDGCFLVELFRKHVSLVPVREDDPIFNSSWMLENLYHDLILLENQIPWFVIQRLFDLTKSVHEEETHFLFRLVLSFFETMMLMTMRSKYRPTRGHQIKHILDLLRRCLLSSSDYMEPAENTGWHRLYPVTDLLRAGIKFKSGDPGDILNIKFNDGVFEIPPILIQSNSESLFRNLIAYEQCDHHCTDQFTSYAVFLDLLINTTKDVDVLHAEGILPHVVSTEDISFLFNSLYNGTLVYHFYYGDVYWKVSQHYRSRWHRWKTTFKRDYFRNPWSISSFIAAILILFFTGTQTVFAMLSYF